MAREERLSRQLQDLRWRIEQWRATRQKLGPMPAALWEEATSLARRHGVSPVARALGVGYEALRERVQAGDTGARSTPTSSGFVEVSAASLMAPSTGAIIELVSGSGARLTIKLPDRNALDLAAVVESFWRHA